jgi:hypothetical protein
MVAVQCIMPSEPCGIEASPVVVRTLIALAVATVRSGAQAIPSIRTLCTRTHVSVVVSPEVVAGDALLVHVPSLIDPSWECAEAASIAAGVSLTLDAEASGVTIEWPRVPSPSSAKLPATPPLK